MGEEGSWCSQHGEAAFRAAPGLETKVDWTSKYAYGTVTLQGARPYGLTWFKHLFPPPCREQLRVVHHRGVALGWTRLPSIGEERW